MTKEEEEQKAKQFWGTKKTLDNKSPSICLAKWTQVTIHLQTGMTHSCHHPSTHKIPLDELKNNISALHNTKFKKEQRKLMLNGTRPKECQYCWNIEDLEEKNISDRYLKSNEPWSLPFIDEIMSSTGDENYLPKYLEVSFSNACNFKCSYCNPAISSKWMEEIRQYGAYPTSDQFNNLEWLKKTDQMPIPLKDNNPYIKAFWEWWPEIYPQLKVFRITGGEPLMSKDTFRILDYFIKHPKPSLEFAVNSNLGVPKNLFDKFINKMKIITENDSVKFPKIFTSIEGWGEKGSYIRNGMDFEYFWNNVLRILEELPKCQLTFMCTFNALSVTSFYRFLEEVRALKTKYSNPHRRAGVIISIPYLRHPEHQTIKILTPDYATRMNAMLKYMQDNNYDPPNKTQGFHKFEINSMKRIIDWFNEPIDKDKSKLLRKNFYRYFNEHDRRRGTNFLKVYPEMKDFWDLCKQEAAN